MVRVSDPIPVEEATAVDRPGTYNPEFGLWENGGTWTWADPILSAASNSVDWGRWPDWDPQWGHSENRISQAVIENLYRCGYALVKVLPEAAE
jgi:hypothetical protein